MKITQVEWGTVAKAAFKDYPTDRDDVPGLAAEMAYWIVFSLFPLFAFLAFVTGIVGRFVGVEETLERITATVLQPLGGNVADQVRPQLRTLLENGGALSFGAIFSALLALNSASAAVMTTMKAFNRAYGVEETRNAVAAKLTALGLTLVLVVLLVGGALLLSLGGQIIEWLGWGGVGAFVAQVLRFVAPLIGISLALAILYWKGPNVQQQFMWISPGSVLATAALVVFSVAFSFYIQLLGQSSFAKTYGAIAGVIIFLLFLRYASTIILLGAEFNAEAAKRYDPETIRDKITDPRKMLPGQQPAPHPQARREAGVSAQQVAASDAASVQRVATGQVGAGAAPGAVQGAGAGVGTGPASADPEAAARLRRLRERPTVSAAERARREQERLPAAERARRARLALAALGVAATTALGEAFRVILRRRARG